MLKNQYEKLSKGSLKHVNLICDYCENEFSMPQRNYFNSRKIIEKDACSNCRTLKRKESCLKKYGTETASKSRQVRKKRNCNLVEDHHDTIIRRYKEGVSVNRIASEIGITRSVLIAYMQKNGLDTTGNVVEKTKQTNIEKYNSANFLHSEEGKKRVKASLLKKYGYENPYENEEYKKNYLEKSGKTNLERYGCKRIVNDPERQKEFEEKRKQTRIKNGHQVEFEGKNAKELAESIGINLSSFHDRVRRLGLETAVNTTKFQTALESFCSQEFDKAGLDYETQYYVGGRIADFKINNILVECDGLYWHSDSIIKDKDYHKNKRQVYLEHGYFPLFFYEDEIYNKTDIVLSILKNKLGLNKKVFARKTQVICEDDKEFFEENHLMGKGYGTTFFLVHNGEKVAGMSIRKIKKNDYEISRFCLRIGVSVVGGFSKLLSAVEKKFQMKSLKTFVDLRYGVGEYLCDFGFEKLKTHLSFHWTDGKERIHRLKFRGNSGYDFNLARIWDCGQTPYTKVYSEV